MQLLQSGLFTSRIGFAHRELIGDTFETRLLFGDRFGGHIAGIGHLFDRRQPSFFGRQASHRMRDSGDYLLWVMRQDCGNCRHVSLGIVRLTRAIAAEEKLRPLRRVTGQLLLAGHRSRQLFD